MCCHSTDWLWSAGRPWRLLSAVAPGDREELRGSSSGSFSLDAQLMLKMRNLRWNLRKNLKKRLIFVLKSSILNLREFWETQNYRGSKIKIIKKFDLNPDKIPIRAFLTNEWPQCARSMGPLNGSAQWVRSMPPFIMFYRSSSDVLQVSASNTCQYSKRSAWIGLALFVQISFANSFNELLEVLQATALKSLQSTV